MNKKDKVRIQFPNILLIPVLSVICGIIKLCNGVDWNWIHVILTAPVSIYFGWCIGYIIIAILYIILYRLTKGKDND